jgi:DNA-binding NarL/FixJ family response regulator
MAFGSASPARILVVDDHPIVRLGIRGMLGADPALMVNAEADSAESALELMKHSPVDLVLVDLSLQHGTGLDLIRTLHARHPAVPVLVLSMHDETLFAGRVLRAGARGYIMKESALGGLVKAIHRVLAGDIYVSERVQRGLVQNAADVAAPSGGGVASLTDRELEVFGMIGNGFGTSAIAEHLGLSVKTVETYRSNIKTKLSLKDATDLIRYAAVWSSRP